MEDSACTPSAGTIEADLEALETLLSKLEDSSTPLEESFRIYEKGVKLVREINGKIDKVEKQMIVLEGESHE